MQLMRKTASGVFWSVVANSSTQLANLLVFVLLARQLPLDELGVVIFALLISNFFMIFVKEGVGDYLVQRPDWDETDVSTAWWIVTLGGLVLTLFCAFVVAPVFGLFYGETIVVYIQALSPTIALGALSVPSFAKARREFKFRLTAGRSFINGVLTAIVALVLALFEMGAWALIVSRLVGALGATALICLAEPVNPRLIFSGERARAILRYCHPILSSRIVGFLSFKAADIFLIALAGPAPLAIYRVGTRIWEAVTTLLVHPMMTVAISTFSRVPAERLGSTFSRMTMVMVAVCLPIYIGLAALGGPLTVLMFGEAWRDSGTVMTILCLAATPQLIRSLIPSALKSLDNTAPFFRFVTVDALSSTFWAAVSAPFGPIALAVGVFIDPHSTLVLNRKTIEKSLGIRLLDIVSSVMPFVMCSAIMFAAVIGALFWLDQSLLPVAQLAMAIPLGVVVYLLALRLFARSPTLALIDELAPMVPGRLMFALKGARWVFGGRQVEAGGQGPGPRDS